MLQSEAAHFVSHLLIISDLCEPYLKLYHLHENGLMQISKTFCILFQYIQPLSAFDNVRIKSDKNIHQEYSPENLFGKIFLQKTAKKSFAMKFLALNLPYLASVIEQMELISYLCLCGIIL